MRNMLIMEIYQGIDDISQKFSSLPDTKSPFAALKIE